MLPTNVGLSEGRDEYKVYGAESGRKTTGRGYFSTCFAWITGKPSQTRFSVFPISLAGAGHGRRREGDIQSSSETAHKPLLGNNNGRSSLYESDVKDSILFTGNTVTDG